MTCDGRTRSLHLLRTAFRAFRATAEVCAKATGAPATRATETGTSREQNLRARQTNTTDRTSVNLDDLPEEVQRTLRQEAQYAEVRSITRENRVGGEVYVINLRG